MKQLLILASSVLMSSQLSYADPIKTGCYGSGEHFVDSIEIWGGEEETISRVTRKDLTYEFKRISKEEFQIRDASNKEVIFRFHKNFSVGKNFLSNTKLVDIYRNADGISALLYSEAGYCLVSASKNPPSLEKGRFLLQPLMIKVDGWHYVFSIPIRDYYQERDIGQPAHSKIKEVKLTGLEAIEFTYQSPKGGPAETDTFITKSGEFIEKDGRIIRGDAKLFKNGKMIGSSIRASEGDETELVHTFSELMTPKIVKETVLQFSSSKEGFLAMILANNRDRKNYDAIKKRVDEAFAEK